MAKQDLRDEPNNEPRPAWAKRLEAARTMGGYATATDFAKTIGHSQQRYSNYENGKREPSYQILLLICSRLGVSTDFILKGERQHAPAREESPRQNRRV